MCNLDIETSTYVFICTKIRSQSLTQLYIRLFYTLILNSSSSKALEIVNKYIKPSNLFRIDLNWINSSKIFPNSIFLFTDTVRFLIPKSLVYLFEWNLKQQDFYLKKIISDISKKFTTILKSIWEQHNWK